MRTINDDVMEHAGKARHSIGTSDGIVFLGLEFRTENYAAGNLYLAALQIINELLDRISRMEKDAEEK